MPMACLMDVTEQSLEEWENTANSKCYQKPAWVCYKHQNQYLVGNTQFSKNQIERSLQEGKREKQNKTNQTLQGIVIVTIYESLLRPGIIHILSAPAQVGVLTLRIEKLRLRDPRDLPRVTQLISGQVEIGIQICLYSPWFCCYALWIYKSISPEYLQCILNVEIVAGLGTGIFRSSPVDFKVQLGLGTVVLEWGATNCGPWARAAWFCMTWAQNSFYIFK